MEELENNPLLPKELLPPRIQDKPSSTNENKEQYQNPASENPKQTIEEEANIQ